MPSQIYEKFKNSTKFYETWCTRVFEVVEVKSDLKIKKFKMAGPKWLPKIIKNLKIPPFFVKVSK